MGNKIVKAVISVFLLVVAALPTVRAEVLTGEKLNVPFTVHGRLRNYMGYAQMRIWIVGSTRMLGVESDTPESDKIAALFPKGGGFGYAVYGDFTVEPLAPDIKGHKRPIRILKVRNVVVERDLDNAIIILKKEL
jgi:hypothetical protein